MSRKPCFTGSLDKQRDKWSKNCSNLNGRTFTIFINHCEGSCLGKKFLLVRHKIVRLFVNTLRVDEKHYLLTRDNLTQTIQIQLSEKQKTFCEFFFQFLKSLLYFKHLPKKDEPHS